MFKSTSQQTQKVYAKKPLPVASNLGIEFQKKKFEGAKIIKHTF